MDDRPLRPEEARTKARRRLLWSTKDTRVPRLKDVKNAWCREQSPHLGRGLPPMHGWAIAKWQFERLIDQITADAYARGRAAARTVASPTAEGKAGVEAAILRTLQEHGLGNAGGDPHRWRCQHTDHRPGPCTCSQDLARDLTDALTPSLHDPTVPTATKEDSP